MLITPSEFADCYELYRQHVYTAVARAGLEVRGETVKARGVHAKLYEEQEIAQAMIRYWLEQRQTCIQRANRYADKARAVKQQYQEYDKDGA